MSQSEDLKDMMAETLSRNNRVKLMSLPENERQAMIDQMTDDIETASDFEIMSYLSENKREVSSDVAAKIEQYKAIEEKMRPYTVVPEGSKSGQQMKVEKYQHKADLQMAGVDIDTELPSGSSTQMGFGANPVQALQKSLSEQFGADVFVTEKDGEIFYLNPKTRKLKLANPGWFGAIGHGMPVAGDVTGTIGAGLAGRRLPVGKQVGAETVGSFLGTATGELTRLTIGRIMGVHDLTGNEMLLKSGVEGAKAAAWTGGAGGLAATFKWAKNWYDNKIFTKQAAIDAGAGAEEAQIAVDEFNRLLGNETKFKGTTGKMSPDVNIQADEAAVRELPEYRKAFTERDIANQKAISEGLDIVTEPKAAQEGVAGIKEVAKKDVAEKTAVAQKEVTDISTALDAELKSLSSTSAKNVGRPTRDTLAAMKKAENTAQKGEWKALKEKHGFDEGSETFGIKLREGEGATRLKKIYERRSETAKTVSAKRAANKIFVGKTEAGKDSAYILLPDGSKHALSSKPSRKLQDLNDYNDELSKISKDIRALESNPSAGQAAIRDLNETKAALKADRAEQLVAAGKEDLLKDITEAELKTAKYYEKYSEGVIGELTKQVDGVYKLSDRKFVSRVLAGTPEEADELVQVIGKNPELMNKWKEGVIDTYKQKVYSGKKFNQEAHERFIDENKEILGKFVSDVKVLNKAGDLSLKLEAQLTRYKNVISEINKDWSGKIQSMDPRKVVDFISTNTGGFISSGEAAEAALTKIGKLKSYMAKNNPAAWQEVQKEFSTKLRNSVQDIKLKQVDYTKLNKAVTEQKDIITEMMGKPYYDNLVKVNKVAEIAAKKLHKIKDSEGIQVLEALTRMTIAPPLSREGRGLTALKKWTKKSAHKIIADAFLDVKTIEKVAKSAEHSRSTREILEIAMSAGMMDVTKETEEE